VKFADVRPVQAVDYGASTIVAKDGSTTDQGDGTDVRVSEKFQVKSNQQLATSLEIGKRIPSTKVLNQSDARPWHFQELLPSNGRWRIIVFTGDISQPEQKKKLESLGQAINEKSSFYRRFNPPAAKYDTVFEIFAVHTASRKDTTIFDFPEVFRNYDEVEGWDYSKIYVDEESYHEGHGKIYEKFGISGEGCAVILRPDQYISYVGPMEDVDAINKFFSGFMLSEAGSGEGAQTLEAMPL
jgi:phenol 2-monooxygenase